MFNDDGFTYRVNGNKVEALRFLDTLMMIPVTKGDNVVELSYCSPGLLIGGIASIIGLLLLGLYLKFNTVITKNSWLQTISVFCTYTAGIVLFIAIIVLPVIYMFIISLIGAIMTRGEIVYAFLLFAILNLNKTLKGIAISIKLRGPELGASFLLLIFLVYIVLLFTFKVVFLSKILDKFLANLYVQFLT